MTRPILSVDLDSTIADTSHRHSTLGGLKKIHPEDWVAYSMACSGDGLIEATAILIHALSPTHDVWFVSGRNEEARDLTVAWLEQHGVPFQGLVLKPVGYEWESQQQYKLDCIRSIEDRTGQKVVLHIDDWREVCDFLKANGVPALNVVPPGFSLVSDVSIDAVDAVTGLPVTGDNPL